MNLDRTADTHFAHRLHDALEREEEAELVRRWQCSGDRNAADRLARAEARHVLTLALKYRRYGLPIDELIAEGNLGVVQALHRFDPGRGVRLATFAAYWIRACILAHVVKSWSLVGGGSGAFRPRMFFKLRRERARVTSVLGEGDAADCEIARRVGATPEKVREMVQRVANRDVSLDAAESGDLSSRFGESWYESDNQEQRLFQKQLQAGAERAVCRALEYLDPRELYIAQRRLLADPTEELSLADLGRYFNVSRERVRQIEARTKEKLRARISELGDRALREWIDQLATRRVSSG